MYTNLLKTTRDSFISLSFSVKQPLPSWTPLPASAPVQSRQSPWPRRWPPTQTVAQVVAPSADYGDVAPVEGLGHLRTRWNSVVPISALEKCGKPPNAREGGTFHNGKNIGKHMEKFIDLGDGFAWVSWNGLGKPDGKTGQLSSRISKQTSSLFSWKRASSRF